MYTEKFQYHAPASVQEATALLGQYGEEAKVVTGGMSLIPLMKLRLAAPGHLIDLRRVNELKGVREEGGRIVIGARTTWDELERNDLLKAKCPVVSQAAAAVGNVQVRNRGTIGGSLVHADPAGDMPAAMKALDAEVTLTGPNGQRNVAIGDFIVDSLVADIQPDEILTQVSVPATGSKTAYLKLPQAASGFALVGVAVVLEMEGSNCKSARIGVTGANAKAVRAGSVEQALAGKSLDENTVRQAAEAVAQDLDSPMADPLNGPAEYRVNLAKVYTRRAVLAAAQA